MREWIELRLKEPANGQAVLISNGGIITAVKYVKHFDYSDWWGYGYEGDYVGESDEFMVTHWMPMPDLPAKTIRS